MLKQPKYYRFFLLSEEPSAASTGGRGPSARGRTLPMKESSCDHLIQPTVERKVGKDFKI